MKKILEHPLKKIPAGYKEEFRRAHVEFFRQRIKILYLSSVSVFLFARVVQLFYRPITFIPAEMIMWISAGLLMIGLWYWNLKNSSYTAAKVLAYFAVLIFLLLITAIGFFHPDVFFSVVSYIAVLFFAHVVLRISQTYAQVIREEGGKQEAAAGERLGII